MGQCDMQRIILILYIFPKGLNNMFVEHSAFLRFRIKQE